MTCLAESERKAVAVGGMGPPGGRSMVSVSEGYARWATTYDNAPNPLLAREERFLLPRLANLREKKILDLACGTGRWLARLIARGESGVGLDCTEAMLRVAGQKPNIAGRLARASCENLPFCRHAFDLVICSFAISHIRDLRQFATELARVVKPSASVFVSDLHPVAYERGWRVGFRDAAGAAEIETLPRSAEEIIRTFQANRFDCQTQVNLRLGDPERPIFCRAGKLGSFLSACQSPAIQIFQFSRNCPTVADSRGFR